MQKDSIFCKYKNENSHIFQHFIYVSLLVHYLSANTNDYRIIEYSRPRKKQFQNRYVGICNLYI